MMCHAAQCFSTFLLQRSLPKIFAFLMKRYAIIEVSILLQPHRTVIANFVQVISVCFGGTPAATRGTLRFRKPQLKNTVVVSWPEPVNHNIRVELVKAGPEKYRNKDGLFQSMIRAINVRDNEKTAAVTNSVNCIYIRLKPLSWRFVRYRLRFN